MATLFTPHPTSPLKGRGVSKLVLVGLRSAAEGFERPGIVVGEALVAKDVEVLVIGPDAEVYILGPIPLVEHLFYLKAAPAQVEAERAFVGLVAGMAFDLDAHEVVPRRECSVPGRVRAKGLGT